MTLSDATLAAALERRHWICMPRDGGRPLWVLVALGKLHELRDGQVRPFAPTVAQATSDLWKVSPKGPRTAAPQPKSRSA